MIAGMSKTVHVVSHGPTCLDGVTAAVAVARYYGERARVIPRFASNSEIDAVLQSVEPAGDADEELWITDISWRDPATDAHLRDLAARGVRIYWIDHHRTAIERVKAGKVDVPLAGSVLSEEFAASRLTWEHLRDRLGAEGRSEPRFAAFAPVVAMADDNDRWLHRIPGSRELAWVVKAMGPDAYDDFLALDQQVTYSPRMAAARARVGAEIARSYRGGRGEPCRAVRGWRARRRGRLRRPSQRDRRRLGQGDARRGVRALGCRRAVGEPAPLAGLRRRSLEGGRGARRRRPRRGRRLRDARAAAHAGRDHRHPGRRTPAVTPALTHLALGVRDLDRTIDFYRRHAKLHVVHDRRDGHSRVVWLSERIEEPDFVLVLLEVDAEPPVAPSTLQHLGFAVASRAEVDVAAEAGRREGILEVPPTYAGPVVGYFCIIRDPDGNQVEFSHGQPIDPRHLPAS